MEYTEEYIDLKQYWIIIRRRWLPALLVMGSVTALTAILTFLQKPIYEAEGQVLLKDDNSVASQLGDATKGALSALGGDKASPISTEIEIVKSRPLIQKTIDALHLKNADEEPLSTDEFLKKLTVTNTKDTDVIVLTYQSGDPKRAATVVNKLIDIYKQENVKSNRSQSTAARIFVESQLPAAEQEVRRYEGAMRQFKERNNVVALQEEAKAAVVGEGDLRQLLIEAQGKLADTQTRTQALQKQLGMSPQQGLAVNALSESEAVQKALVELQNVQRELATAETNLQPGHPQILDLQDKQAALQSLLKSQVGQVVGRPTANTPSLQTIQAGKTQQELTKELVQAEVERLGLENQVAGLLQTQANYQKKLSTMPRLEQIARELERKLEVAQTTYGALLKSLQEFRIAENQNVGNVFVVAPGIEPIDPISPKILLNLAIGTVMGLLLGVGTALLLEALDTSIKTVKEAEEIFDLTVLGTIPALEGRERVTAKNLDRRTPQLPVRDNPRSMVSEAYRMLQANLKFLSSDNPPRVITLTSSVPQEGKSTSTANLALVLAEMGHRVLVVDADLRRPSQHQIWELPNSVGLTNILVDSGKWSGVVRSENEQLDIITAGVLPPNPVKLLDSQRMAGLIDEWRTIYDYVLVDTPPLAVAADALLLSQITDGILMVARPGVLDSASAETAKTALAKVSGGPDGESKRSNILGLLLNGVIPENEPDSYYYYYAKDYYAADLDSDPVARNGKASVAFPEGIEDGSRTPSSKP